MDTCVVPGCPSEQKMKGMCGSHYSKWRKSGWTMTLDELAAFKPNRGRLHPDTKALVESLNAQGLSMKQIAKRLGVNWPTLRSWKAKGHFTFTGPMFTRPMLNRTCDVAGCDRDHDSHGMCNTHLQRWIRSGRKLTLEELAAVPVEPGSGEDHVHPRDEGPGGVSPRQGHELGRCGKEDGSRSIHVVEMEETRLAPEGCVNCDDLLAEARDGRRDP